MTLDYFYGQSGELFSYFRIPKALFQDSRFRQLSTDARTLYGILLDRMSLSVKNGWMDKQGRVYIIYTVREVQESLCCAEHKAVKLFRELEQIDLIERKRRGLGRPSLIYVKDFTTGLSKTHNLNCANSNSGVAQSAVQERPKPQANKTDKNKTEMNKPDPIHSGDIREQLEDYFYQALEVELLLRLFPDDEDTIYQIVDLLVDTCATKRRMHLLLKEEQTAAYSVEIWKRFRKWGGIPTGLTQNVKDLLSSREVENIFENSDMIIMLNQAAGDRQILAKQLNISPHQLSYPAEREARRL